MSDEEIEQLTAEELATEFARCKLSVWERLKDGAERMDEIEESLLTIKGDLKRSEIQRASYNNEIKERLDSINIWADRHGDEEMDKYKEIIASINNLSSTIEKTAEETEHNTKLLAIKARKEEVEAEVEKRLGEAHKDYNEYKKTAIKAIITIAAIGMATIVWEIILQGQ